MSFTKGKFFFVCKKIAKASGNDIEYLCYHFFKILKDV